MKRVNVCFVCESSYFTRKLMYTIILFVSEVSLETFAIKLDNKVDITRAWLFL